MFNPLYPSHNQHRVWGIKNKNKIKTLKSQAITFYTSTQTESIVNNRRVDLLFTESVTIGHLNISFNAHEFNNYV